MTSPRLCLALSVSLALLQTNLLPVFAGQPIWQKLSGTGTANSSNKLSIKQPSQTRNAPKAVLSHTQLHQTANRIASFKTGKQLALKPPAFSSEYALMFFLRNKAAQTTKEASAALTIHPAISDLKSQNTSIEAVQPDASLSSTNNIPVSDSPGANNAALLAMNSAEHSDVAQAGKTLPYINNVVAPACVTQPPATQHLPNKLLAQLAPDQVIAQSYPCSPTTANPIPPVVAGTVDLEEFKTSNTIDLKVSQSRTFRLRNKIVRTSISDPSIAEPVVVSENQIVLLGKAPGGATLVIWDDAGNSIAVDVNVSRDYCSLQSTLREIDPRIIVKPFSVGGSDRVILLGDVDHAESVIRAFSAANAFMDDRGMSILAANSRLLDKSVGEKGMATAAAGGATQTGQLAQLAMTDKYLYFSNLNSNVSRAQAIVSDGGRVTSLIKVRKTPLIVLHCTFMEMNSAAARELGVQLGLNFTSQAFSFGLGGNNLSGTSLNPFFLTSLPGTNGTTGSVDPSTLYPSLAYGNQIIGNGVASGTNAFVSQINSNINSATTQQTFIPAAANVLGFFNGAPMRSAQFGATSAPVNFTASNTIPQLIGGQLVNTPISAIGQGVFTQSPAALLGQSILLGAPGGATFNPNGLGNLFTAISNLASGNTFRWSLNPSIQGIITHSRSRVLAEPTLVTISGERASFLAGGEIPILQAIATAGQSQQSVVFEPFGLRLNMIPVLLENGSINLEVSPEERLLSNIANLNIPGSTTTIPSFTTRKTQTVVEMKPGQELFISGLVTANSGRELDKTPVIGEIPVLGALYRSKAFSKNESELVVAVRPEIIIPGTPGQWKMPEEIDKTEATRDTNVLQVEPTVLDERYMTSGQNEHPMSIQGEQPPGASIPDNQ